MVKEIVTNDTIDFVLSNLNKNNMEAYYIPHIKDVQKKVLTFLQEGNKIAVGGSFTLEETDVLNLIRNNRYQFIDRYEPDLSPADHKARLIEAFTADVFLCSANAITINGEIYQVDGLSNRIAPLVYGPDCVIIIAGINKIVENIQQATYRVKTITAPAIVKRRGLNAPCAYLGSCISVNSENMADGCMCDDRRCCNYLVLGRQRIKGRIKVILVGEHLGF